MNCSALGDKKREIIVGVSVGEHEPVAGGIVAVKKLDIALIGEIETYLSEPGISDSERVSVAAVQDITTVGDRGVRSGGPIEIVVIEILADFHLPDLRVFGSAGGRCRAGLGGTPVKAGIDREGFVIGDSQRFEHLIELIAVNIVVDRAHGGRLDHHIGGGLACGDVKRDANRVAEARFTDRFTVYISMAFAEISILEK